jgi:hypothetical protein
MSSPKHEVKNATGQETKTKQRKGAKQRTRIRRIMKVGAKASHWKVNM